MYTFSFISLFSSFFLFKYTQLVYQSKLNIYAISLRQCSPTKKLYVYKNFIFFVYTALQIAHTLCCIEYNINSSYEEKCVFSSFWGGIVRRDGGFIFSLWGWFSKRGIWCYDHDDDDDECVEDEICDFENFQLNEIESFFFPFSRRFFFLYCCNVWYVYENVFLFSVFFVWGFSF